MPVELVVWVNLENHALGSNGLKKSKAQMAILRLR